MSALDVVVIGSGAAGLAGALRAAELGLRAIVVEKEAVYGGSSAVSGGSLWIPCNGHPTAAALRDDVASARAYLLACAPGALDPSLLDVYLTDAPRALRWLEAATPLRFHAIAEYADYHQHLPGAQPGLRTLEPEPLDGTLLGDDLDLLRPPLRWTLALGLVALTAREARRAVSLGDALAVARAALVYLLDIRARLRGRRDRRLTLGAALVGGLRIGLAQAGVPVWLGARMCELLRDDDGRVIGVEVERSGRRERLEARGVLLAAGGFEGSSELRARYLPKASDVRWTATPGCNVGDGLRAGLAAGAATAHLDCAWFAPTTPSGAPDRPQGLFIERALPGCIVVNGLGLRFVDEAAPYIDFVAAMIADHASTGRCLPAWMIFDAGFRRRYPAGPLLPGVYQPDVLLPRALRARLARARTLPDLARKIDVDPEGLERTVEHFNAAARIGVDKDFGKGGNAFDVYYGDTRCSPNPCLAPLERGPFYALPVWPGDIGTCGGLRVDVFARVLGDRGPIPGLYAAGNTAASITGGAYPGAGATLGPALVMAMRAAEHVATVSSA